LSERVPVAAAAGALALLGTGSALADPPRMLDQHFTIDPVSDIVLTGAAGGFSVLLSVILSTGEIRPAPLAAGDENRLLSFDRVAVTQSIDPNADTYSNVMLYSAVGFAVLDPILTGLRDGSDAWLVDTAMYAESISLTESLTDLTKIAVRRPRPIDYIECSHGNGTGCASTDLELSFFSGHSAVVSAITGTASYLAFVRSPHSVRPWLTLGFGTLLTALVGYERVRAGAHFPTDVIAGTMAGAAVGVLVPHLHRHQSEAPSVWVGAAPTPDGNGATIRVGGLF
jgi:undecaprenyl-diphosphatase